MHKRSTGWMILAAALALPAGAQDSQDLLRKRALTDVAVVTELRGAVTVVRGSGAPQAISATTLLAAGDRVQTPAGGGAVLWLADGQRVVLGSGETRSVADLPARPAAWFVAVRRALAEVLSDQGAPVGSRGFALRGFALRGGDTDPPLVCDRPRSSSLGNLPRFLVLDGRPVFNWRGRGKVTALKLDVTEKDTLRSVLTQPLAVDALTWSLPSTRPPLPGGNYVWEIRGVVDGKKVDDSRGFRVPTPTQAKSLQADAGEGQIP